MPMASWPNAQHNSATNPKRRHTGRLMSLEPAPGRRLKRSEYDSDVSASLQPKRSKRTHGPPISSLFPCAKRRSAASSRAKNKRVAMPQPPKEPDAMPTCPTSMQQNPSKPTMVSPQPVLVPLIAPNATHPSLTVVVDDAPAWEPPKAPPIAFIVDDNNQRVMKNAVSLIKKKNDVCNVTRGRPWNAALDATLCLAISKLDSSTLLGKGYWPTIAQNVPGKSSKQCRERWVNHLDPDLARDRVEGDELRVMLEIFSCVGRRWSCLAGHLNAWRMSKGLQGYRSDGSIKNLISRYVAQNNVAYKPLHENTESLDAKMFWDVFKEDADGELSMSMLDDLHLALASPPITAPEDDRNIFATDDSSKETTPVASLDPTRQPGLSVKILPAGVSTSRPFTFRAVRAQPFGRLGAARKIFNFEFRK